MPADIPIALALGAVAGSIDALPMLRMNVPRPSVLAVFAQWVLIGLLIPFVDWDLAPWLKGLILGELGMTPFMIQALFRNRRSILPTALMAAFLGTGLGVASQWLPG